MLLSGTGIWTISWLSQVWNFAKKTTQFLRFYSLHIAVVVAIIFPSIHYSKKSCWEKPYKLYVFLAKFQTYRVTPKTTQLSSFRILLTVSKIWILLRWVEFEKIKHKYFSSQMYSHIMRIHVKKSHSLNYFCWEQWVVNEFWG